MTQQATIVVAQPAKFLYRFFITVKPSTMAINQKTINIKKITLATDAAPAAIPVKPKMAAIIAITKNIAAHLSIMKVLK